MSKSRLFLAFLILFFYFPLAQAQGLWNSDRLFSPSTGQIFYEIAYELANSKDVNKQQAEQAIMFLIATSNLDNRTNYILPDMIKLVCRDLKWDHSFVSIGDKYELVYNSLMSYVNESSDLEVAEEAIRCLLGQLNSREEREELLKGLLSNLNSKNKSLDSEVAALLASLMAEKADTESAQFYFIQAYHNNKYNKLAFEKLTELMADQIEPVMYLEHLRLALGENPLDIEAAFIFAQYAEQLQLYKTAADAYKYCVELFRFLYPSKQLSSAIYLPWAISNYNTQRNQHKCLQIADELRQDGLFDLYLETIAGKAAMKIGDAKLAEQIFQAAEKKALQLAADNHQRSENEPQTMNYEQLAWFYCFAIPDADKALDWANKAYSSEPNSPTTAAILAYSLVMNEQTDWAKMLINNYEHTQISDLALAQIQLTEEQKDSAIETLKSAIAQNPGSLEARDAKEILAEYGREYIAPVTPDITLQVLRNNFGQTLVPVFINPEKMISIQLHTRGSKFYYGHKFDGTIEIINNSFEPLVISDNGLFKGNIRVDANIRGDLNRKIPNLVSVKIRPASPIEPGQSILIPVHLVTGELRQILLAHPQASLDIEFTIFLDPITTSENKVINRVSDIKPSKVVVKRLGIELTNKFLQNRLNSLSTGKQGQKNRAAKLFSGLLMEQSVMANREPLYKFMYADWMPTVLKSALVHNLADDNWIVKVYTMAAIFSLPLDYELINAVSENMDDTHWPVRLMTIYLLAKNQDSGFDKVLNYSAKYDQNELVRDMAIALGAEAPKVQDKANQNLPNNQKKQPTNDKN